MSVSAFQRGPTREREPPRASGGGPGALGKGGGGGAGAQMGGVRPHQRPAGRGLQHACALSGTPAGPRCEGTTPTKWLSRPEPRWPCARDGVTARRTELSRALRVQLWAERGWPPEPGVVVEASSARSGVWPRACADQPLPPTPAWTVRHSRGTAVTSWGQQGPRTGQLLAPGLSGVGGRSFEARDVLVTGSRMRVGVPRAPPPCSFFGLRVRLPGRARRRSLCRSAGEHPAACFTAVSGTGRAAWPAWPALPGSRARSRSPGHRHAAVFCPGGHGTVASSSGLSPLPRRPVRSGSGRAAG